MEQQQVLLAKISHEAKSGGYATPSVRGTEQQPHYFVQPSAQLRCLY